MTPKERVLSIYNSWYKNNRSSIISGKWDLVNENILVHPEQDTLRGLNLIAFLPPYINKLINNDILPKLEGVVDRSG